MKEILKTAYYNLSFTPQFSPVSNDRKIPRPYWGILRKGQLGGPVSRTLRMKKAFGDFPIAPNLIHANSAWDPILFKCAIRMKKRGLPLVFNQNGHYYPAWYKGDYRARNQMMVECQKNSDFVIFQSAFSKETQKILNGYVPENHIVLHNAVPAVAIKRDWNPGSKIRLLLTGVFGSSAKHILQPALEAMKILSSQYVLVIAGQMQPFPELETLIQDLKDQGKLEIFGSYEPESFREGLSNIDFALHLKYKDCCPNAVVEKMLMGIPLIYSDSGGTPELIGDAGISLKVRETWDEMVPVNTDDLVRAIEKMSSEGTLFYGKTWEHARKHHSWERYVATYREIFEKVLGT